MAGLLTPQRQTAGNGLLDQAPRRVDDRVAGLLGLDPSIQRGAILPFGRDASGEMVMAWPEMALDTLKSLMLPGHVMQGGEFTPRDVTEMALDVGMLSTVAPAPAGAKRMFGGISAKNAPLDDLAKAEEMEKAGEADSGPQMSASLPMDEASRMARAEADKFEVARQNAARSVEDGGLGLYDGSEPVNRAIEMGFDDRNILYHQTKDDIKEFKLNADAKSHSGGGAVWLRDDPRYSLSAHQTWKDGEFVSGTNEVPVIIKPSGELPVKTWSEMKRDGKLNPHFPQVVTVDENKMIRDMGFTHARVGGEVAVFDPSVILSRFAAFDPARKDSTDILASYLGVPGIGMLDAMPQDDQSRERRGLLNN